MSDFDWDEIANEIDMHSANKLVSEPISELVPETPSAADIKRMESIAARARERAELDAIRAAKIAEKQAKKAAEEEDLRRRNKMNERTLTPYEKFINEFLSQREKELGGFKKCYNKDRVPTRGPDYEKAYQDANAAWRKLLK